MFPTEFSVTIREVNITDVKGGEDIVVRTIRTAREIAELVDATEKEVMAQCLEKAISEADEE